MLKFLKVLMPAVLVAGCGLKPSIDDEKLSNLDFSLVDFFVGETMAHGQFQDVLGNVSRRFNVTINGSWDGNNLVLVEDFVYSDGAEEQRIWTLTKNGDNEWQGYADGVVGGVPMKIYGEAPPTRKACARTNAPPAPPSPYRIGWRMTGRRGGGDAARPCPN